MYELQVFHAGSDFPTERVWVSQAAEVLESIPKVLQRHSGCERVVVSKGALKLFSVDCAGNRIEDTVQFAADPL